MDLLKVLKRTTIIAGASLLAFGATDAQATDNVAYQGHISASVVGTMAVSEISAINFGNFAAAACAAHAAPVAGTLGTNYIKLSDEGTRTSAGCFTLMNGAGSTPIGVASGTNDETGGQTPGFYTISNADGVTNIYVSFADITGDIVDSGGGANGTYNHPNNYVTLTPDGSTATFAVNQFTFETDSSAANGTSGYHQGSASTWDSTTLSGNYVACGASCTLRVGALLHPLVAAPAAGKYTGTFYIMVSY
jgi:hypothetical protein